MAKFLKLIAYFCMIASINAATVGNVNLDSPASPWVHGSVWVYGTHVGLATDSPPSWASEKSAVISSIDAKPSGTCFIGYVKNTVNWTCTSTRTTPIANTWTWDSSAYMPASFVTDIRTHENYHRLIYASFISNQFGSLESFINSYESKKCATAAAAKALATSDINAAFAQIDSLRTQYNSDKLIDHGTSYSHSVSGSMVHVMGSWGPSALSAVNAYTLTFVKSGTDAECPCP